MPSPGFSGLYFGAGLFLWWGSGWAGCLDVGALSRTFLCVRTDGLLSWGSAPRHPRLPRLSRCIRFRT